MHETDSWNHTTLVGRVGKGEQFEVPHGTAVWSGSVPGGVSKCVCYAVGANILHQLPVTSQC